MTSLASVPVSAIAQPMFGFTLTPTGLVVPPDVPTYTQWTDLGYFLRFMEGSVAWLLGDWLTVGEAHYGEIATQAMEVTALDSETLRKYAWVAERVSRDRRVATLSFTHHQVVASLTPAAQSAWLAHAATGEDGTPWTVRHLRHAIAEATEPAGTAPTLYWIVVGCLSADDREAVRAQCAQVGRQVRDL